MVNLCQATQTTILAPNPMLQGALLMQQMQGNMRNFGMGGQQFRQFFAASSRSSLLGPVPMGMAIKTPIISFPAARPFHPHARFYNSNPTSTASSSTISMTTDTPTRQTDRKRDSEQMAAGSSDDQPAASAANDSTEKSSTDGSVGGEQGATQASEDQLKEPAVKKQRTEGSEESSRDEFVVQNITPADTDVDVPPSECDDNVDGSQLHDREIQEEGGSAGHMDVVESLVEGEAIEADSCLSVQPQSTWPRDDNQQDPLSLDDISQVKESPLAGQDSQEEGEDGVAEGTNKFYCYLCSITCHNQQNFRSHMNSISHQQRMMEIQHMSNACLVTLLPRVQESLQGTNKEGEKKGDMKHWCSTCHTHFTSSLLEHRRTEEHKLASRTVISSCTVCKKHFRTSQIFVEHLQSPEHRQRVEELQEKEGSEALGKLTATDTDGFSLEELGDSEAEEGEVAQRREGEKDCTETQDGWSSCKEVTLEDMASDEQYDPDTVYGSNYFVPVAGFICRLCNNFYHFESSALHTHCKSLKHFEKLKKYKELLGRKDEAVVSSRESTQAVGSPRPGSETAGDCSDTSQHCDDSVLGMNTTPPGHTENEQQRKQAESGPTSLSGAGSQQQEEETLSQAAAELPAAHEGDPEPMAAAEDTNKEEGKKAPAALGRTKAAPKRRSGRAANRR